MFIVEHSQNRVDFYLTDMEFNNYVCIYFVFLMLLLHLNYAGGKMTLKYFPEVAGGVAQAAQHLLSKHKALSSNPSTAKQTNKKHAFQKPGLMVHVYNPSTQESEAGGS
jgi:hypothetical protein